VLAMALTFSCSHGDENPFAIQYLYCVNPVEMTCVPGPFYECQKGAAPKDVCPAEFVEKAPSSSSGGGGNNDPFADVYEYYSYEFFGSGEYIDVVKEFFKYYDPDEARCRNGIVEYSCGEKDYDEVWFNLFTHRCVNDNGVLLSTLRTYEHCGNTVYLPPEDGSVRCQDGVPELLCGDVWVNAEMYLCYHSSTGSVVPLAMERCGSKYYLPDDRIPDDVLFYTPQRCRNGVVEITCEGNYPTWYKPPETQTWYDPETQYCIEGYNTETHTSTYAVKAIERCGSGYIRYEGVRCNNGVIELRCDGEEDDRYVWYNPITQSCGFDTYTVKNKLRCGS
jgi:hypothetical protein